MVKNDDPEEIVDSEIVPAVEVVVQSSKEIQPTGRVVGIIKRNWRTYVCHLDRSSLPPAALTSITSTPIFASPVSRSIPRIRILTRQAAHLSTQKFLVSIDSWPITSRYPEGHFVRALGEVGSKEGELESLLEEWEVPYRAFSASILECLPEEGENWVVPEKDNDPKGVWQGREDLRDMIICSIDPPGWSCLIWGIGTRLTNILVQVVKILMTRFMPGDYPMEISKLEFVSLPNLSLFIASGADFRLYLLYSDIADVSHFVHPDNPMDAEAASRGTTVYLVDKRVDMLPHLLGTNLCSLRPYVERLAFSVLWVRSCAE